MKSLLALIILVTSFCSPTHAQSRDEQSIRTILSTQVAEWNKGNIEGYMHGYWPSDSLVFIGKNGPTYGYNATLTRYKSAYPDTAYMGRLTSTVLSIRRLSAEYYFVIGHWALTRTAGNVEGSWTLLFHKIKGQWVIVVDHSS